MGDVGVSIPPLRGGSGQIAMEGKMMRKTIEKMREYDIKQWEKKGKEGKMMRKTMEKRRDFDIKQWKQNGKAIENLSRTLGKLIKTRGETVERIGRG